MRLTNENLLIFIERRRRDKLKAWKFYICSIYVPETESSFRRGTVAQLDSLERDNSVTL